jgi:hypothetical protein
VEILHPPRKPEDRVGAAMNYVATIGEREVKVTVEELGGSNYKVTLDGREVVVDAHQVANRLWSVLYGFASLEVDVTPVPGDAFEVLINGDCHKFSLMNEQRRAMIRAGAKGAPGRRWSPPPCPERSSSSWCPRARR